jgi:hypothetical protein
MKAGDMSESGHIKSHLTPLECEIILGMSQRELYLGESV